MDWVLLIGRILFASQFVTAGLMFHLLQREMATGYARAQGAPLAELSVPGTGVALIVAGAMVIVGFWVDLAALVLAALMLSFAYWMHSFWKLDDPERTNQMTHFFKNVQLAGGALILFFLFYEFGEAIDLTIGDPALFND